MKDNFSIQDWRMSMLTEGYEGRFYAPEYLVQKYGKDNAKRIEAEIEDMDMNAWDRFTGMESAEEVEAYIADIKDMIPINEVENEIPVGNREIPLGQAAGVTDQHQDIIQAIQDMVMSGDHTILDLIKQKMQAEWGDDINEDASQGSTSGNLKLMQKSKDVTVSVNIKKGNPIDTYKLQQYVNELTELIQNHINKGK